MFRISMIFPLLCGRANAGRYIVLMALNCLVLICYEKTADIIVIVPIIELINIPPFKFWLSHRYNLKTPSAIIWYSSYN
jgi:hypothetical protein